MSKTINYIGGLFVSYALLTGCNDTKTIEQKQLPDSKHKDITQTSGELDISYYTDLPVPIRSIPNLEATLKGDKGKMNFVLTENTSYQGKLEDELYLTKETEFLDNKGNVSYNVVDFILRDIGQEGIVDDIAIYIKKGIISKGQYTEIKPLKTKFSNLNSTKNVQKQRQISKIYRRLFNKIKNDKSNYVIRN